MVLTPIQLQRIISGLKKTFIKRYIVERTNKAEKDWNNRVRNQRVVGRIYGMKYIWKGHKDRNRQEQNKKEWASSVGLCLWHQPQHPHHLKVSPWGLPLKPGVGQYIAMNATPTARDFFLANIYLPHPPPSVYSPAFFQNLSQVFPPYISSFWKQRICFLNAGVVRSTVGAQVTDFFLYKLLKLSKWSVQRNLSHLPLVRKASVFCLCVPEGIKCLRM